MGSWVVSSARGPGASTSTSRARTAPPSSGAGWGFTTRPARRRSSAIRASRRCCASPSCTRRLPGSRRRPAFVIAAAMSFRADPYASSDVSTKDASCCCPPNISPTSDGKGDVGEFLRWSPTSSCALDPTLPVMVSRSARRSPPRRPAAPTTPLGGAPLVARPASRPRRPAAAAAAHAQDGTWAAPRRRRAAAPRAGHPTRASRRRPWAGRGCCTACEGCMPRSARARRRLRVMGGGGGGARSARSGPPRRLRRARRVAPDALGRPCSRRAASLFGGGAATGVVGRAPSVPR